MNGIISALCLLLASALPQSLPIDLPEQTALRDCNYTRPAFVALRQGWAKDGKFLVVENGRPITSQSHVRAKWPDGSAKFAHVVAEWKYRDGKPLVYDLLPFERRVGDPAPLMPLYQPEPYASDDLDREYRAFGLGHEVIDAGPLAIVEHYSGDLRRGKPDAEPFMDLHSWVTTYADRVDVQQCFTIAQDMRGVRIAELGWRGTLPGDDWAVVLRDDGNRKPFRVSQTGKHFTIVLWPNGGTTPQQLTDQNFHTFPHLHSGQYLDFHQPEAFEFAKRLQQKFPDEWRETKPHHLRTSSPEGISLVVEFSLVKLRPGQTREQWAKFLQLRPVPRSTPEDLCDSGAFGDIAPRSKRFTKIENGIDQAFVGFYDQQKLRHDGWANYGNAPERLNGSRANFNRMSSSAHAPLHGVWLHVLRGAGQDVLDVARRESAYEGAFGQCRHAPDANDLPRLPFKGKVCWGFYHCKSFYRWGTTGHWLDPPDTECATAGHFVDPYALQLAWLHDCDWFAKQGYDGWLGAVQFPAGGIGRDANCSLAQAYYAWKYTGQPKYLEAARRLASSLIAMPLRDQAALNDRNEPRSLGVVWYPIWPMIADEVLQTEASRRYAINAANEYPGTEYDACTLMGLAVGAVKAGGDPKLLERFLPPPVPRQLYPNEPGYQVGPGAQGEENLSIAWPYLAKISEQK